MDSYGGFACKDPIGHPPNKKKGKGKKSQSPKEKEKLLQIKCEKAYKGKQKMCSLQKSASMNLLKVDHHVLFSEIIMPLMKEYSAPFILANLRMTCKTFNIWGHENEVLKNVNLSLGTAYDGNFSERYSFFIEECASAGNEYACYIAGMSYCLCLDQRDVGLAYLKMVQEVPGALYFKAIVSFVDPNTRNEATEQLFRLIKDLPNHNLSHYINEVLGRVEKRELQPSYFSPVPHICTAVPNCGFFFVRLAYECNLSYWLSTCSPKCRVYAEYNSFCHRLRNR